MALALAVIFGCGQGAQAQDAVSDFFDGMFGGYRHAHPRIWTPPWERRESRVRRLMPHREYGAPTYWHGESWAGKKSKSRKGSGEGPAGPPAPGENPPVEPSFVVAVIGDSLGQMLADGLDEAFEAKPELRVLHKAKESSGLVRDDFYDWPKAVRELLASNQRIDMALMMIGSNDRQALRDGSQTHEALSPRWRELYAARVDAIRAVFKEKKIPLVWVGLPVMKNERFSADMAQFNEIYRDRAAHDGGVYLDLWEAFADERNQYDAFGPDLNGHIVKLRSADGVHFTDAGARKLAHFVEGDIRRASEAARPPPSESVNLGAPGGAGAAHGGAEQLPTSPSQAAPPLPERPAIGRVQSLTAPMTPPSEELARRGKATPSPEPNAAAARALVEHIFVEGRAPPPQPGRADDFSWPRGGVGAAGSR
ncbi:MAG: DUF459 domain-containing protein [Methylocystis sp.]|nr:DUF459 domain-containing protein [Methylocystis sp.]